MPHTQTNWAHLIGGPRYQLQALQAMLEEAGIPVHLVGLEEAPLVPQAAAGYAGIPETMLAAELLVPPHRAEEAQSLVASLPPDRRPPLGHELPDEAPYGWDDDDEEHEDQQREVIEDAAPVERRPVDPVGWLAFIGSAVAMCYLLFRLVGWLS